MAMMGLPLVSYQSLDKSLDRTCRWAIYTERYECVRCNVVVDRLPPPARSVQKPGLTASNVLPNWGLYEKYHQKQTLGWDRAGAGRLGHRRRRDFPERSRRKRAGRD